MIEIVLFDFSFWKLRERKKGNVWKKWVDFNLDKDDEKGGQVRIAFWIDIKIVD